MTGTFHDADTGVEVAIAPQDVASYRPTYVVKGTTVSLSDGRIVQICEAFREFHTWIDPHWSKTNPADDARRRKK